MRVPKYQPLTDYLIKCGQAKVRMTFKEIEGILGSKLPESAYTYTIWWVNSNQTSAVNWLKAGYIVSKFNVDEKYAVFEKAPRTAELYISRIPDKTANKRVVSRSCNYISMNRASLKSSYLCFQLISASQKYYSEIIRDPHARYLSWEHCYSFFQNNRVNPSEETLDLMCLHLAWYLASWGMLRGSSFLLRKDYKVHLPVVRLLISKEYEDLNACSAKCISNYEVVDKIMELSVRIDSIYLRITSESGKGRHASDTLITKILLGTLGCVPAYDSFFKSGLSISNVAQQRYSKTSLLQLANYYVEHEEEFEEFRHKVSAGRVSYTPMKIIDMCFWQLGFDNSPEAEPEEEI